MSAATSPGTGWGLQRRVDILRLTPYIQSVERENGNGEESTGKISPRGTHRR